MTFFSKDKKNFERFSLRWVIVGLIIFLLFLFLFFRKDENEKKTEKETISQNPSKITFKIIEDFKEILHLNSKFSYSPPPPSWELIKYQGCVADGILNGWGGKTKEMIEMINRSECRYLHRAIETWLTAPNFKEIEKNLQLLNLSDENHRILGMFFAEAIDKKEKYFNKKENRYFDFSKMCQEGTDNFWGEHSCRPSLEKKEYQEYLLYIGERAIDLGVQVFLFGQIYYQDSIEKMFVKEIISKLKEYADFRGIKILIGAQTNNITKEDYLALFDFIEGGAGIDSEGNFDEELSCSSHWWNPQTGKGWCWALLWHDKYRKKAKNVLIHLDWSGRIGDDMSNFAKMESEQRIKTLEKLYFFFQKKEVGFLMPFLAVLPRENDSCYGPKKGFYSASNEYGCGDEEEINNIFKKSRNSK